ncbi:hypothetical protein PRIPAC_98093 [Pristionchus pacificus]|uniref:Zinc finger protein n=1 Tax=Pristionchus pacificus TaxID=54126 RepID=A0A2A6BZ48_PRIPA|nr:hypothetical protein PRIPAC_98093 [Pristionchus pacificus]|eukprot:PDM71107.1 zinc finger protein [Pristionchus pacificus]
MAEPTTDERATRQTACFLLRNDDLFIGGVLTHSLHSLTTAVQYGLDAPVTEFNLKSLIRERKRAMEHDDNKDDPERCSIYELSGEIVSLIEELKKRKRCEEDDEFKEQQLKEEEELEIQAIMNKISMNDSEDSPMNDITSTVMESIEMMKLSDLKSPMEDYLSKHFALDKNNNCSANRLKPPDNKEIILKPYEASSNEMDFNNNEIPQCLSFSDEFDSKHSDSSDQKSPKHKGNIKDDAQILVSIEPESIDKEHLNSRKVRLISPEENIQVDSRSEYVRKHKCDICNRFFGAASHLRDHMTIHNGSRPIKCTLCYGSFINTSKLKRHMRDRHNRDRFECETCVIVFKRKLDLTAHLDKNTCQKKIR